jgi:GDPmannose 4,6-dehydratase
VAGRRALITGISGQDGSYVAELLLAKGYEVHGTVRPGGADGPAGEGPLADDVTVHEADLLDAPSLRAAVAAARPAELYHLAAPTFVPASWQDPTESVNAVAGGTATLLACARERAEAGDPMRMFVAASSEVFGDAGVSPQSEEAPMRPRSPYGVAKLAALGLARTMRGRHHLHVSAGILFNHESPRRGLEFVTRKVTYNVARIKLGLQEKLPMGNLDAKRDWGFAGDYVDAMWRMLQQPEPDDYVVATNETHTVRELVEIAFERVGLDWQKHVVIDPAFVRPAEVDLLIGDYSKAKRQLGWEPRVRFSELVQMMVDADLARLKAGVR